MITYIEVCAGIGGFSHAAEMVNEALGFDFYQCAGFSEIEPFCIGELSRKWPHIPQLGRIENVTDELDRAGIEYSGFFGGIPCQPYSEAGAGMGAGDARDLWTAAFDIIRATKPRWVCIENVSGFASHDDGLPRLWNDLESEGYEVGAMEIPACAVGASHERMRTFIVAYAGQQHKFKSSDESGSIGIERFSRQNLGRNGAPSGSEALADCQSLGQQPWAGLCSGDARRNGRGFACDCGCEASEAMADAAGERCRARADYRQERRVSSDGQRHTEEIQSERSQLISEPTSHADAATGARTATSGRVEPRVGQLFDELALPVVRQQRHPALMGEAQHDWEPPRLAPKGKQWKQQISALGNAIVPVQLFPILLAIALSELELMA